MCFKPVHQWNGNDFGFKASKNRRVKSHSKIMRISHEKFMNHLTIPRRDTVLQDGSSGGRGGGGGGGRGYTLPTYPTWEKIKGPTNPSTWRL